MWAWQVAKFEGKRMILWHNREPSIKPISNGVEERTLQHKVWLILTCICINAMIFLPLDTYWESLTTDKLRWSQVYDLRFGKQQQVYVRLLIN